MCKESVYLIFEFFNYYFLTLFGLKYFVDLYEIQINKNKWLQSVFLILICVPISMASANNHKYYTYSNTITYTHILYMYFVLIFNKVKRKGVFSLISIYINVMRLLDLGIVAVCIEISRVSRHVKIEVVNKGIDRIIYISIFLLIYFIVYKFLCRNNIFIKYLEENKYYRRLICLYSYLGILCFCTVYRFDYREQLIGYWTFYLVCAFILFGTFIFYLVKNKGEEKERVLNMRNKMMEENYNGLRKAYDNNKTLQHDYKNHLLTVGELIKENKIEDALNYINTYIDYGKESLICVNSGNDIIDIIVNSKIAEAKEKNIVFKYQFNDLNDIIIEDIDICSLLSNLLDNAIDACSIIEEKKPEIYLKIIRINDMLLIHIINTIDSKMANKRCFFESEKGNSQLHGWGMKSIERVINKYGGSKQYYIEKDRLEIFINIPN